MISVQQDASWRILYSFFTMGRVISLQTDVYPNHSCIAHVFMLPNNTGLITNRSKPSLGDLSFASVCMWIIVIVAVQRDSSFWTQNRPGWIWWQAVQLLRAISIITKQSNHCGFLQLLISADNQPVFWSALDPQGWTGAVMRLIATSPTEVCSERTFPSGPAIWRSLYRWEEKRTCPAFGSVLSETLWRARMPDILTTLLT